jgi:hypothetical protein
MEGAPRAKRAGRRLLALPSKERLARVLERMLDEKEFLSPHGLRSLSAVYRDHPASCEVGGRKFEAHYVPGESDSGIFGGNSNWRGPVWFPLNYLLIEALEKYHHFYGDSFRVEFPTGSGQKLTLQEVAQEIARRMVSLFVFDQKLGRRPYEDEDRAAQLRRPAWKDLLLFYEYFDGDTGRGLGASHQTGWTALVVRMLEALSRTAQEQDANGQHAADATPEQPSEPARP